MRTVYAVSRISWAAAFLAVVYLAPAQAQITISSPFAALPLVDGQSFGRVVLLFKVQGLTKEQMSLVPEVTPVPTSEAGPKLVLSEKQPTILAQLKDGAVWQVHGEVSGLPLNSSVTLPVLVHLDKAGEVLSYSVTNTAPAVDVEVSPGGDTVFLETSRETDFMVNVKGRPLRGLAVCQSTLADTNTGNHLQERDLGMYLADDDLKVNPQVGSPYLTLTAASTKVHLFVSPDFQEDGVFAGNVGLCSASKAVVTTLKLTVNSSTSAARMFGAVLILAGIALYIFVTVILKQRSLQLTAEIPAARLAEALEGLQVSAKLVAHRAKVKLPVLLGNKDQAHSLQWLIQQLSTASLKKAGYLPAIFTNPFQAADAGTSYQQFLQAISAQELNDATIVRDGLQRVMSLWQHLDEDSARDALGQLDQLALHADAPDVMRPKVDAIVNAIPPRVPRAAGDVAMLTSALSIFHDDVSTPPTVHELIVQLEDVGGIGWLIWALLTFLIGYGVLILSNHGFGTWQDLSKCFLWGLGIQAAGQGLQSLGPTSAATTFSLQIGH